MGWLTKREIITAGLGEHESYCLSLDKRYDPEPDAMPGFFRSCVPEGWRKERSNEPVNQDDQREFCKELVALTWKPEKWDGTRRVAWTARFSSPFLSKFARRLCSVRKLKLRMFDFFIRKKGPGVDRWVRVNVEDRQPDTEEFIDRFDVIKCEAGALRCDTWEFYDFRVPEACLFPSKFHDLSTLN
jgi:hypothetical protein